MTEQTQAITDAAAIAFVYQEARTIDEKRFDDWYEMFAEDGLYWMPLARNQPDGRSHNSLFHEDRAQLLPSRAAATGGRVTRRANRGGAHAVSVPGNPGRCATSHRRYRLAPSDCGRWCHSHEDEEGRVGQPRCRFRLHSDVPLI